jgi:hypothetical protein
VLISVDYQNRPTTPKDGEMSFGGRSTGLTIQNYRCTICRRTQNIGKRILTVYRVFTEENFNDMNRLMNGKLHVQNVDVSVGSCA